MKGYVEVMAARAAAAPVPAPAPAPAPTPSASPWSTHPSFRLLA